MGLIRFEFNSPRLATRRVLSSMHMVGFDGTIWPCRTDLEPVLHDDPDQPGQQITLQRNATQSGRLFLLFPFPELGEIVVGTGTVLERDKPYWLDVELARGTLNRLRNQLSNWAEGGLEIPQQIAADVEQAQDLLSTAIYQLDQAGKAIECLEASTRIILQLSVEFGRQVSEFRKQNKPIRKILFGIDSPTAEIAANRARFPQSNTIVVPAGLSVLYQKDENPPVEEECWVRQERLADRDGRFAIAGPLISARPDGFPDWIQSLDHIEKRRQAILDIVQKSCDQLAQDPCDLIHAVAGINGVGHRFLSFSQQLHLTIDIIQMIESSKLNTPILVSFDQPWGERIAWSVGGGHSLQIADTLLRHGCRIDALGLEINLDYWPNGSLIREPTQWTELFDFWSHFGLPIFVLLRLPFGESKDLVETEDRLPRKQGILGEMTVRQRANFINSILPLILSRPNIQGILWCQSDEMGSFPRCQIDESDESGQPIIDVFANTLKQWQV